MRIHQLCVVAIGLAMSWIARGQATQPLTQPGLPPGAILRLGDRRFAVDLDTRLEHVAFSPDGRYLVTATNHGIDAWYAHNGDHVARMINEHHPEKALFVGAKQIAALVWAGENQVNVYDAESGECMRRVNVPRKDQIHAFTAGEKRVAIITSSVQVFDTDTGEMIYELPRQRDGKFVAHEGAIRLSADGKTLAARMQNDRIRFFNIDLKRPCGEVEHKDSWNEHFWLSGDGNLISLIDDFQRAVVFTRGGKLFSTVIPKLPPNPSKGYRPFVGQAVLSRDGRQLAMTVNQSVEFYPVDGKVEQPMVIPFKMAPPHFIEFSPGADKLAVLFGTGRPVMYRTDTGKEIDPSEAQRTSVHDVLATPDGKELIVAARDSGLFRWSLETGKLLARNDERQSMYSQLAWMPDLGLVLDLVDTGVASVVDAKTLRAVKWPALRLPSSRSMRTMAISADGTVVLFPTDGSAATLIDVHTGESIRRFEILGRGPVNHVALSPNNRVVVLIQDGKTSVCDSSTSKRLFSLPGNSPDATTQFSRDGRFLLVGTQVGLALWDLNQCNGKQPAASVWRLMHQEASHPRFSPSQRLIIASSQGDVVVYETATGTPITRVGSHLGQVTVMRFITPDRFVSAGTESTVYVWSLREAIRQAPLPEGVTVHGLWDLAASPNAPQAWRAGLELLERGELERYAASLPVEPSSPQAKAIRDLLGQLQSDDPALCEEAHRKLEGIASRAVLLVEEAMQNVPPGEYLDRLRSLADLGRRAISAKPATLAMRLRLEELLCWDHPQTATPSSLFPPTTQASPEMIWLTNPTQP